MTKEEKIGGYLGLAARGRNLVSGEFSVESAVKSGKAHLVLVAGDASENTTKKFQNMCDYYHVPFAVYSTREGLGNAVGKGFRAALSLTDAGLAKAVIRVLQQNA